MKSFIVFLFYLINFIYCDCPVPGFQDTPDPNLNEFVPQDPFDTYGFQVTVSCNGIATGISHYGNSYTAALYASRTDDNTRPGLRLAISNSSSKTNGVTTEYFATPVQVSQGYYFIFGGSNAIFPLFSDDGSNLPPLLESQSSPTEFYVPNLDADYSDVVFNGITFLMISMWLDVTTGTPCTQDWDCASLGVNYGFATCQDGYCACIPNFQGSATSQDPCTCNSVLAYENGIPYCVADGVCLVGNTVRLDLCGAQNYAYVQCNNGQCQCLSGFQGNGTTADPCRCESSVSWEPVCGA